MSSAELDEPLPPPLDETPPVPHPALLDKDVLFLVFSQLLDDPAALAQLSVCACVCTAWREAVNDPRLWTSLTRWQRLPRPPQPLDSGELAPIRARDVAREAAEEAASESGSHDDDTSDEGSPRANADDELADEVNRAVLRRLVARSGGKLKHLDATPLRWLEASCVLRALTGQGLEGQLESLRVEGVDIQADLSSLGAFKETPTSQTVSLCMYTSLSVARLPGHGLNTNAAGRLLALGDPEKGKPPDERFAAYLDDPPPANPSAAAAIYLERTHAKLAAFVRKS